MVMGLALMILSWYSLVSSKQSFSADGANKFSLQYLRNLSSFALGGIILFVGIFSAPGKFSPLALDSKVGKEKKLESQRDWHRSGLRFANPADLRHRVKATGSKNGIGSDKSMMEKLGIAYPSG